MMKKILFLAGMFLVLMSCTKESDEKPVKTTSDYLPLAIGNYWIYELSENSNGTMKQFQTDSLIITGDTLLWGSKYYRLDSYTRNQPYTDYFYRGCVYKKDSSMYLVDSFGRTLFSETNFSDTLYRKTESNKQDTFYTASYKMEKPTSLPQYIDTFKNVLSLTGTILPRPKGSEPLYTHLYYAKGIGEIAQNYYYLYSRDEVVRVLIRYKVY